MRRGFSREDNEAEEKSSLDWLNLNAIGTRAIGALDRMRTTALGGDEARGYGAC